MQKGQLFKRHGAWHLRYRRADGQRVCTRLAPYNDSFRTQKSVRPLAEAILTPINEGREVGPQTLKHFIEQTYLPAIKSDLRPSTVKGYTNLHNRYLAPRIGDVKLWEFRTVDAQRLLNAIAASTELSNRTFFNIKTFLSSVFTDAKRLGVLDSINPVQGVKVPKGQPTEATYAYSLDEVKKITGLLEGAAQTAVIVAAWTGLSMAELRGLQWADVDADPIIVRRTCWNKTIGPTKTTARNAPVPLLPVVREALEAHHQQNPGTIYIFEGSHRKKWDAPRPRMGRS